MTISCRGAPGVRSGDRNVPGAFFWPLALAIALALPAAGTWAADNLQTKNEIIDLMLCYGEATDTFGVASNPDSFNDGLALYEECFTEDASFNLWPPGADFGAPAPVTIVGPKPWADFVVSGLDGNSLGQHMLTNFSVDVDGKTGTLSAYLSATRATYAGGAVASVVVANGTYTLQVEKIRGAWKVKRLELRLISFVPHFVAQP